ncbi:MAG: NAD(P)H-binding protein [Tepidisphaeraceae bacterium]
MAKIAITGGTGFVGAALADVLRRDGHELVLIARRVRNALPPGTTIHPIGLDEVPALTQAFVGCDAVAHLAGINRELGPQTYRSVHVDGTANVIAAARAAGVRRIAMLSFLRARPNCGSPYHESKWQAEQLIRASALDFTIVKSGVIYGRGDHLLDHLSHALFTLPLFATVGLDQPPLAPVAVQDVARILSAALLTDRLRGRTVAVVGPQMLAMREIVHHVAAAIGRRAIVFPLPVMFHRLLGRLAEAVMRVPLISSAQVRMLREGLTEPFGPCDPLPPDLAPATRFSPETVRPQLPLPGPFRCSDLRCCCSSII